MSLFEGNTFGITGGGFSPVPTIPAPLPTGSSGGGGILGSIGQLGSLLGGGGVLNNLFGAINLQENISNVMSYGLSSWGASTTPEKSKAKFSQQAVPYVQSIIQTMNANNIEQVINEVEKYISFVQKLEEHKLRHHSRAKSTKLGREVIVSLCKQLRTQTVTAFLNDIVSKGGSYTSTTRREENGEIEFTWSSTDNSFHGDGGYNYKVYAIALPDENSASPTNPNSANYNGNNNGNNNNVQKAGGMEGLIALAVGYFAFKKFF